MSNKLSINLNNFKMTQILHLTKLLVTTLLAFSIIPEAICEEEEFFPEEKVGTSNTAHVPVHHAPPPQHIQTLANNARTMEYLGAIEGRSYLADISAPMNWTTATLYCNRTGFKLASIETVNQGRFLANILALPRYTPHYFWTSGRESRSYDGFVWDSSGLKPNPGAFYGWYPINAATPYQYCARMRATTSGANKILQIYTTYCSQAFNVLCMT